MASLPTGTVVAVATGFGAVLPFTAPTNAAEVVLLMASTAGLNANDIVEVTSTWGKLNKRAARVKAVVANVSITLEGIDTQNLSFYPAGGGAGSVREVSTWQNIDKITDLKSNGGEPKTVKYKYMDNDTEFSLNDGFSAQDYTLTIDADAIGTAGYTALKALTDVQSDTLVRITSRNASIQLLPSTVALNEAVQMNDGQINTVVCAINGNNRLTRYAAP